MAVPTGDTVLYSSNIVPPSWIHVFKGTESTSLRSQAAAIAYMFPHLIYNMMGIRIHLRPFTACNRRIKLETHLQSVHVPPHFIPLTNDECEEVVVVCDGGFDHKIPHTPPRNKVSIAIISFQSFPVLMHPISIWLLIRSKFRLGKFSNCIKIYLHHLFHVAIWWVCQCIRRAVVVVHLH